MTILVVDVAETNRRLLRAIFSAEGYHVLEADDGLEALQILGRDKIDVIVSDILMPNMDGYRLCAEVRRDERFRRVWKKMRALIRPLLMSAIIRLVSGCCETSLPLTPSKW